MHNSSAPNETHQKTWLNQFNDGYPLEASTDFLNAEINQKIEKKIKKDVCEYLVIKDTMYFLHCIINL